MGQILDEVKIITAKMVAEKNDKAKLNFPSLVQKIKSQAELGFSYSTFLLNQINEYDKKLLESEGFRVLLEDVPKMKFTDYAYQQQYKPTDDKQWKITW